MSCMWVSMQACGKEEISLLAELAKRVPELKIVLSNDLPAPVEQQDVLEQDGLEKELTGILRRLGVRPNLKGYQYLKTAVEIALKDREELEGITKRLYPSVARRHGTGADRVEYAIRHAIESGWPKGRFEEEKGIFGYHMGEGKRPTNAEFITGLIDYLEHMTRRS